MGTPQIGDVIKFAELAWTLLDYGWSEELNASKAPWPALFQVPHYHEGDADTY